MTTSRLDSIAIDTIRFLAVDMVEEANSGHPGAPMAQAPLAYWLWTRHLRHDPGAADWPDRDRFVLSCGHASALLYAMLHLAGYDLPMEELQRFRQLGSKTPGHPEFHLTPGVETTTGPLGQGISNAVGMAIAERYLGAHFNRDDFSIVDHHTWAIASDGDLMEGVAAEASSMAGHLRLGKLNVFYDANQISIDGSTDLAFTEDVAARYRAYGWHTLEVADVNDLDALDAAIDAAKAETDRPSLIVVRTEIGYGSPNKQGTSGVHGSPLGADERQATRDNLGWAAPSTFHVPDEAREAFADARRRGEAAHAEWLDRFARYRDAHPTLAADFERLRRRGLPAGWDADLPTFTTDDPAMATRKASGKALAAIADKLPELLGGSADLAPSNNTFVPGRGVQSAEEPGGANFHYGVREHGMGAAMNGMALSGMLRPYGATFLIFADYMRPSIRLAALMEQPALYVFTHDSIFLGEDGPTHQPISQLMGLRSIPGLSVVRPADANETVAAWRWAVENVHGPTALVLTRQGLPILDGTAEHATEGVRRGAYVLADAAEGEPAALLIATGSEVALAVE
ncbi:MAG: transketolase, partial [Acidobacteriota bacterium]